MRKGHDWTDSERELVRRQYTGTRESLDAIGRELGVSRVRSQRAGGALRTRQAGRMGHTGATSKRSSSTGSPTCIA